MVDCTECRFRARLLDRRTQAAERIVAGRAGELRLQLLERQDAWAAERRHDAIRLREAQAMIDGEVLRTYFSDASLSSDVRAALIALVKL